MKIKILLSLFMMNLLFCQTENIFLKPFNTPFKAPDFSKIKIEDFKPAYIEGFKQQKEAIDRIINNPEEPSFENTIIAIENSGEVLDRVGSVFGLYQSVLADNEILKLAKEITPLESKHNNEIGLNEKLFQRIKKIYDSRKKSKLNADQLKLVENYYRNFVRNGIMLDEQKKERVKKINEESSMLTLKFNENVLKETINFKLIITNETDLAGLPESVRKAAYEAGEQTGNKGNWVFTLDKPSMLPFLQYSEKRDLREKLYKGYLTVANKNNEFDNKEILKKIALLRLERSKLFGYKNFADFRLEINMAKKPKAVYDLLMKLWKPALKMAKKEAAMMQDMIKKEGNNFKLESWDWWYYAEKIRKEKYNLDENEIRPYFELNNVREGAFYVANKLYGLTFIERKDIPSYHQDVKIFEVKDKDGKSLGMMYTDYFPRSTKRSGAWCSSVMRHKYENSERIPCVITNNGNFSKPTKDTPALLSLDEASTLFHEFGHGLHNLLSEVKYAGLASTPRDFVELPSQIMEHWVLEPEVLKIYAKHYKTGEIIPKTLLDKINAAGNFNQGFETIEFLAAAILDMDYHTIEKEFDGDADKFEKDAMTKIGLIPEIESRYRSTYFKHIFSGGYSAGYYSYIWAEVLDCDAFEAFKEKGLFDQATAKSFRENILSKGGSIDGMEMYKKFRGREPKVEPLLKKRGLM